MKRRIVQRFIIGVIFLLLAFTNGIGQLRTDAKPSIDRDLSLERQAANRLAALQANAGASAPRIRRNIKLERRAAKRLARLTALLNPEAERKLNAASQSLVRELVKQPPPADVLAAARAEVEKVFLRMSRAQTDLTTFYALAAVARYGALTLSLERHEDSLDSLADLTEDVQLRLQLLMDRRSKAMEALSNIMKKISETSDTIIQNLK